MFTFNDVCHPVVALKFNIYLVEPTACGALVSCVNKRRDNGGDRSLRLWPALCGLHTG